MHYGILFYDFDGIGWDVGIVVSVEVGKGVGDVFGSGDGIDRDINYGVIRSVVRNVDIRLSSDVGGEVESGNDGEFVLEVRGKVGSRYGISVDKDFKVVVNARIYESVDWGFGWIFVAEFCRGVDDKVNLSMIWVL